MDEIKREKVLTGVRVIDEENDKFIELYHKLIELHKKKASKEEIVNIFKMLGGLYKLHSTKNIEFMRMHAYSNIGFLERFYVIQLRNLEQAYMMVANGKREFSHETLNIIKEAISNNFSWDRHHAVHLKHKYGDKVNDILNSIHHKS